MMALRSLNRIKIIAISLLFIAFPSQAAVKQLPRFATIRSEQVNSRVGPGLQYPLASIFIKKAEPIEIIQESGNWRQIKDFDGESSWIHVSLLSSKRAVVVKNNTAVPLFKTPFQNAKTIANVGPNFRCSFGNDCYWRFCKVECAPYKGWIERSKLWGIYDNEFQNPSMIRAYFKSYF